MNLTHYCFGVSRETVVWTFDTFENYFEGELCLHYRESCIPTCAECNFWAFRLSLPVQVDQLVSYQLVFIDLRCFLLILLVYISCWFHWSIFPTGSHSRVQELWLVLWPIITALLCVQLLFEGVFYVWEDYEATVGAGYMTYRICPNESTDP